MSKGPQKTVVKVEMVCCKCKKRAVQMVAGIEGVDSIAVDPSKSLVTVVGEADPVLIVRRLRRFSKSAEVVSVGPHEVVPPPSEEKQLQVKPEEKKTSSSGVTDPPSLFLPTTCHRCEVWYLIGGEDDEHYRPYCSIL